MKPKNIEERKAKRKKSAVLGVVFFVILQLASAICLGALCLIPGLPRWCFILFGALAALCILLIFPAIWVLKERFREIEGGELDEAGQY